MALVWFATTVFFAAWVAYDHREDVQKFIDWIKAYKEKEGKKP